METWDNIITPLTDLIFGWECSAGVGDRNAWINGTRYRMSEVLAAIKRYTQRVEPEGTLTVEELGLKAI